MPESEHVREPQRWALGHRRMRPDSSTCSSSSSGKDWTVGDSSADQERVFNLLHEKKRRKDAQSKTKRYEIKLTPQKLKVSKRNSIYHHFQKRCDAGESSLSTADADALQVCSTDCNCWSPTSTGGEREKRIGQNNRNKKKGPAWPIPKRYWRLQRVNTMITHI